MLATAPLPHQGKHDVAEIDAEVRAVLTEIGGSSSCGESAKVT